jgi:sterol desaturase/sphingolipid hydroxylase (fatty acid hydroxylase superfamily)
MRVRNITLGVTSLAAAPLLLWLLTVATDAVAPLFTLPIIWQLVALDLWAYATHRAYHRVPLLWRFHAPHHFDEHLNVTSAFRFHIGEIMISGALRLVPALCLGISVETLLLFEAILLGAAAFHHSNVKLPVAFERALSWVIVTPSLHWVHHHNIRADTDSNYAAILSLWDRLFGSKSKTERTPTMTIGVEAQSDRGVLSLLAYPFVQ